MDEEESTVHSTEENMEPAETEENAGEEIGGQNVEDNKSEGDKMTLNKSNSDNIQIDDDDKFGDDVLEQRIELEKSSKVVEEFELLETSQQTEEEEREKQKELMEVMESTQIESNSSEDDEDEKKEDKKEDRGQEEEDATEGKQLSDKESVFTKGRGSILYEMGPRIRDGVDVEDFFLTEEDAPIKFYKFLEEKAEEECEEEIEYEEEEIAIDRAPYYEKHEAIKTEILKEKVKNNILQKKLAKFFKRRKMEHVLKETDQQVDTLDKYGKKLIAFGELSEVDNNKRTVISSELKSLKWERDCKFNELNKMFKGLMTQEKDTGYGLIYTKTGKPIPDKLVERMLHRQKQQIETVGDMRLRHIQLKNMVLEKQNAISQLDKIGDNLYLMDYEQLKVENRSYVDKMEEKDEELCRLRTKCQKTIQILAHMREKSSALECDIKYWNTKLENLKRQSVRVGISILSSIYCKINPTRYPKNIFTYNSTC